MKLKKIRIGVVIVLAVIVGIFCMGRYGWKWRGFDACESAKIESIVVYEDKVEIVGADASFVPDGFIGYYAKEKDGKLYVGFRFSALFGFFETGKFHITIPTETKIEEIYIKTKKSENLIWSAEDVKGEYESIEEKVNQEELNSAYDEILDVYGKAIKEQWNMGQYMEAKLNYLLADCHKGEPLKDIGYAIVDLDENGIPELLVGSCVEDDFFGKMIFFLYTLGEDGKPDIVFSSAERNRYYYAGESTFVHMGSSGADADFHFLESYFAGEMIEIESEMDCSEANYVQMDFLKFSERNN